MPGSRARDESREVAKVSVTYGSEASLGALLLLGRCGSSRARETGEKLSAPRGGILDGGVDMLFL